MLALFSIGSTQIRSRRDFYVLWEMGAYKPPYKHLLRISPGTCWPGADRITAARGKQPVYSLDFGSKPHI